MNRSLLPLALLWLAIVASGPGRSRCRADEPAPSLDTVLAKWQEAAGNCRTLDAKLTVFHYDSVVSTDRPTVQQGRFTMRRPTSAATKSEKAAPEW